MNDERESFIKYSSRRAKEALDVAELLWKRCIIEDNYVNN